GAGQRPSRRRRPRRLRGRAATAPLAARRIPQRRADAAPRARHRRGDAPEDDRHLHQHRPLSPRRSAGRPDRAGMTVSLSTPRIVLHVMVPFAAGYIMVWLLRSVNAVVAPDLVRDLGLTASGLGLLTSAYFFTYAAMQLPVGLLLDRFGPRRTQSGLFLFAALGCLGFAVSQNELTL